ncbi:MAG: DNA repair protein RadA [Clostridia bacterium]|nr:DNA repair protein RadA [Clostridia bacterium]
MKGKKPKTHFVCQVCGHQALRWQGQCVCGAWNSLVEELVVEKAEFLGTTSSDRDPLPITDVLSGAYARFDTGDAELNRVLGGGLVKGSLVLISGDPGIGKSTLLLQVANKVACHYGAVLYVSGEESEEQIKMRAERLGVTTEKLFVVSETNIQVIEKHVQALQPVFLVLDSIQTVYHPEIASAPGSVSQVRECAGFVLRMAKRINLAVFLVAHVTKQGQIAGPRVLDHLVDCVLFLEGEKNHGFRMLRPLKNRYGTTAELALYEMVQKGLEPIDNPSRFLLGQGVDAVPGTVVVASVESARPILVELQSLVVENTYGIPPRKVAVGVDRDRLSLIAAVLQKRAGLMLGSYDLYVSLLGGVEINETSIDLGLAVALFSSLRNLPVDPKTIVIGEVDLAGRVRPVPNVDRLVKEGQRLGFTRCLLPQANLAGCRPGVEMEMIGVHNLQEALAYIRDQG